MARRHSGAKGKSSSTKPSVKKTPQWLTYKPAEVEKLIEKHAKEGMNPSKIGLTLRDKYGIPDVQTVCGKKITEILTSKNIKRDIPEDLQSLIKRSISIRKHIDMNKQDGPAQMGLILTESKIGRLAKYYKKTGRLSMSWKWDPKQASKFVE